MNTKGLERVRAVTHSKIRGYHTTPNNCDCRDFQQGGSFSSPDHRDCKHTLKIQAEIAHFNTEKMGEYWVCRCNDWLESDGEGLQGSCVHTEAMQGWKHAKEIAHV